MKYVELRQGQTHSYVYQLCTLHMQLKRTFYPHRVFGLYLRKYKDKPSLSCKLQPFGIFKVVRLIASDRLTDLLTDLQSGLYSCILQQESFTICLFHAIPHFSFLSFTLQRCLIKCCPCFYFGCKRVSFVQEDVYEVSNIIKHPDYYHLTKRHDIAILGRSSYVFFPCFSQKIHLSYIYK